MASANHFSTASPAGREGGEDLVGDAHRHLEKAASENVQHRRGGAEEPHLGDVVAREELDHLVWWRQVVAEEAVADSDVCGGNFRGEEGGEEEERG